MYEEWRHQRDNTLSDVHAESNGGRVIQRRGPFTHS